MNDSGFELHVYPLHQIDRPAKWRVLIVVSGQVVYKQNWSVDTELDAARAGLKEFEILQKG